MHIQYLLIFLLAFFAQIGITYHKERYEALSLPLPISVEVQIAQKKDPSPTLEPTTEPTPSVGPTTVPTIPQPTDNPTPIPTTVYATPTPLPITPIPTETPEDTPHPYTPPETKDSDAINTHYNVAVAAESTPTPTPTPKSEQVLGATDEQKTPQTPLFDLPKQNLKRSAPPALSFFTSPIEQNFYKDETISKDTTYALLGLAVILFVAGIGMMKTSEVKHQTQNIAI